MRSLACLGIVVLLCGCGRETGLRRVLSPPEVTIVTPEVGQELRIGEDEGVAIAEVTDTFDLPQSLMATWFLDDESTSATVSSDDTVRLDLRLATLAPGEHTLRLVVVDSDGMEGEDEITWTVLGALQPPSVQITSPDDGARLQIGQEVTFRGEATDNNTSPNEIVFTWHSSIDQELTGAISGDGQSVLFDSTLSQGVHQITLEAFDVDGLSGSDSIVVTVTSEPVDAQVGDVVFSEILVRPLVVEDLVGEWIELYNTSNSPIDLDGYSLHDLDIDSYVITGPLVVAPDDFVVLCADTDPSVNGGIPCDAGFIRTEFGGNGSMALGNNGDEVVLSRPDGTVIDQVVYQPGWFDAGVAKGVDPDVLDASNNDDESMWCNQVTIVAGATEPGTPGLPNDPCP